MNVVRRSAGLFLFVAMLICGCDLSPGSEFTGKWVNAKDPTETVDASQLPTERSRRYGSSSRWALPLR